MPLLAPQNIILTRPPQASQLSPTSTYSLSKGNLQLHLPNKESLRAKGFLMPSLHFFLHMHVIDQLTRLSFFSRMLVYLCCKYHILVLCIYFIIKVKVVYIPFHVFISIQYIILVYFGVLVEGYFQDFCLWRTLFFFFIFAILQRIETN